MLLVNAPHQKNKNGVWGVNELNILSNYKTM